MPDAALAGRAGLTLLRSAFVLETSLSNTTQSRQPGRLLLPSASAKTRRSARHLHLRRALTRRRIRTPGARLKHFIGILSGNDQGSLLACITTKTFESRRVLGSRQTAEARPVHRARSRSRPRGHFRLFTCQRS